MLAETSATVAVLAAVVAPILGLAGVIFGGRQALRAQREAQAAQQRAQQAANEATAVQVAQEVLVETIHEMRQQMKGLRFDIAEVRQHHAECEAERVRLTKRVAELERRR